MDLTLLISTFLTVFLAELGDKTQLATVALSGTSNRPLAVFLGSSSALVLASLLPLYECCTCRRFPSTAAFLEIWVF